MTKKHKAEEMHKALFSPSFRTKLVSFGKKLYAVFSRNIGMKLLAFALAFMIWIVIMGMADPVMTKQIDGITLEYRHKDDFNNKEENKFLSIDILTEGPVSIKVSGSRSSLEDLTASDFVAYADFNDFGVNAIPIKVEARTDSVRKNVEIMSQSLTVMQVRLVNSKTKLVNVQMPTAENVPDDKYVLWTSISSNLLEITGPEEVVDKISVLSGKVDFSRTSGTSTYVSLVPYDKDGNEMDDSSLDTYQKIVQVEWELLPTKDVPIVIDTRDTPVAEGYGIYGDPIFSPVEVRIAASPGMLRTVNEIKISFESEDPLLKSLKPIAKDFEIKKYLPEGVYLKSEHSSVSVNVTVEKFETKEITFSLDELDTSTMPNGFVLHQGESGETTITMVIRGLESDLAAIRSASDLNPYVDLRNVTKAGTQTFPIKLNISSANTTIKSKDVITTDSEASLTIAEQ